MALQNGGFSRRIYEDSDADLQLQGFFNEIASPIMSQVDITYLGGVVDETSLTTAERRTFFEGTELIVAGKLTDDMLTRLDTQIFCNTVDGPVDYMKQSDEPTDEIELPSGATQRGYFERLWAYLTIKEILARKDKSSNGTEKAELKQQALDMSLKVGVFHWKLGVIMVPTLSSLAAPQVVVTRTCGGASDGKVGIMATVGSECLVTQLALKINDRFSEVTLVWSMAI